VKQSGSGRRGTTFVEVLTGVAAVVVLLAGAIVMGAQRLDQDRLAVTMSNLRKIDVACKTYAADWHDRQFSVARDNLTVYGDNAREAIESFRRQTGNPHPPIELGRTASGELVSLSFEDPANDQFVMPISFDTDPRGWFRLVNAGAIAAYLEGRFYDPVFYAPDDSTVMRTVERFFDMPGGFQRAEGDRIYFSSYCFSPAALMHPQILGDRPAPDRQPQWKDPWSLRTGLRAPAYAHARYPQLKSHILEHHWLQNRPVWATECNDRFESGTYDGCDPYYFNHYGFSAPATLFYDGHVQTLRTVDVIEDDERLRRQSGWDHGLWLRHPGGATDGYYESHATDPTRTSYHIYTLDGIRGRDVLDLRRTPAPLDRR
jgi:hypothetical protein